MRSSLFLPLLALVVACSSPDTEPAERAGLPEPPAECAALPSLTEARQRLVSKLDAAQGAATALEPVSAYRGAQVPLSVGYVVQIVDGKLRDTTGVAPFLVRSLEELEKNETLKGSAADFDVDWAKESMIITVESARTAIYRYAIEGTTLVAYMGTASPCLAKVDEDDFPESYPEIRVLKVPKSVESTRAVVEAERYRMALPKASGACTRAAAYAANGGGDASVSRGPSGFRLYFGGFSAMTGNVFFGESTDGKKFTPDGWDMAHLSRFEDRGPYAGIYGASVDAVGNGWRMTAHAVDPPSKGATKDAIVEMTSADGIAWSKSKALLPPTTGEKHPATAPFRITVDGEERLYFARGGDVRVARRRGAADFVEDAAPVLARPTDFDSYDSLGYGDPEVARIGDRFVLFFSTFWGGLSAERPWRGGIGYATSTDGLHFTRADAPLLVPELEDEASGLFAPSVLVDGDRTELFFSAINRNAEPAVKRASCTVP